MLRRTKVVATLGPSCDEADSLYTMLSAGVDVVRLNFSHGSPEDHKLRAQRTRECSRRLGREIAVLGDLQGPKIRIARFANGPVEVKNGDVFVLDAALERDAGDQFQVGLDYKALPDDVEPGNVLLLDDGRIEMRVERIDGQRIHCRIESGGKLSNNKGINLRGGGLSAAALTDKDRADIKLAAEIGVDYLAVSFPRSASDMIEARRLLIAAGGNAGLVAKIERAEVVRHIPTLDQIIDASDAIMVARGDLGVEIGDAELVGVQKSLITRARERQKVVITATQMMESMIEHPYPTRAEVFDVANAVLDGTDAVMLSAETASGKYPVQTVQAMVRIIIGAEQHPTAVTSTHRLTESFGAIDESIAMGAMYIANHLKGVKAIICMTETGTTPRLMSRINSSLPIFALARRLDTQRRLALFRDVYAVPFITDNMSPDKINHAAIEELRYRGVVKDGDLVILSKGDYLNVHGGTNAMKIVRVGSEVK